VQAQQCPEWNSTINCIPTYKNYYIVVSNCVLEHHWELANERTKAAQILFPQSQLKVVLTILHEGRFRGHLSVNKTLGKVGEGY
jgi:hypothetical protein